MTKFVNTISETYCFSGSNDFWVNVYQSTNKAAQFFGVDWYTREAAQERAERGAIYRIHVKLKEQQ